MSCAYGVDAGGIELGTELLGHTRVSATICSNIVFSAVIPLVQNWASSRANQIRGSAGQNNGEILILTAVMEMASFTEGAS